MIKGVSIAGIQEEGTPFKKESIQLEEAARTISLGNLTWIECVVDDIVGETPKILEKLGITMDPKELLSGYLTSYEDQGDTLGLMFPFIVTGESKTQTSPLLIFIKKDLVVTIHDDYGGKITRLYNYSASLMRKLPQGPQDWAERQTLLLFRIIDEISETNFSILRLIIEQAEQLELDLAGARQVRRDLAMELSNIKTSVLTFLNAVWATHDTVRNLKYGDADMMADDDEILEKFEVILGRLDRQIQMSENVMEVIGTGISVIQTETSNKLTTLIVWLTVAATAVLVPNTIATVFGIPDLQRDYGWIIPILVISTVISAIVTYRYTKRWRVMPFKLGRLKKLRKKFR
ncbi:MAG: CorA family divalent cation transporter [Nitrosopumilaceae archaeon]